MARPYVLPGWSPALLAATYGEINREIARAGDANYGLLARRWARTMGVLFAVGAVSGTILSFEMGLLWPGLMGRFGQVIGLRSTHC